MYVLSPYILLDINPSRLFSSPATAFLKSRYSFSQVPLQLFPSPATAFSKSCYGSFFISSDEVPLRVPC